MNDERTYIRVKEDGPGGGHRGKYRESYDIPVPEDDQLREDIEDAIAGCYQLARAAHEKGLWRDEDDWTEIARRLRAWAGLDQEDDNGWKGYDANVAEERHVDALFTEDDNE